jgi:hypothetical protein
MAVQECANGHLYDTDQYASCPYCEGGGNRINFGNSNLGKTVAAAVPVAGAAEPIGSTVAPASYRRQQEDRDTGKTVAVFQKRMNCEPVVGWLVCLEGAEKGKDYRIYGKNNTIGRSEKMDICIKGDSTISRENHARLAYDEKHNAFHLIPGESTNTIYLNDEPVYMPTKLEAYDIIELGDCKMTFVPFCNEKFSWQTGFKQG